MSDIRKDIYEKWELLENIMDSQDITDKSDKKEEK